MSYKLRSFAKRLLYRLKRSWGGPVDIYQQTTETVDWTVGKQTPTVVLHHIRLACLLPIADHNKQVLARYLKSEFRYGGITEYGDRQILVDRNDLKGIEIGIENWYVIIDGTRYQIVQMQDFGEGTAWLIYLSEDGGKREAQVVMTVKTRMGVNGEPTQS